MRRILLWLDNTSARAWLTGVLVLAVAQRLSLLLFYQPVAYNDTPSYRHLANTILAGWKGYDGTRTPGYSLVMAVVGPDQRVWLVQLAMGLVITLLFFYLGWQLTGKAWFGGLAALAYTLNPGEIWFESNLLSETPTTFWVTLSFACIFLWIYQPRWRSIWLAVSMGLFASLAWLTRPLFIFLPFWLMFFMFDPDLTTYIFHTITHWPVVEKILARRSKSLAQPNAEPLRPEKAKSLKMGFQVPWVKLGIYLVPVFLILGGWLGYIHKNFRQWAMDTMTGYHLVQHTGDFFQYVPDEYADLRDTYLKYRDAHVAEFGTQTNTIWEAIPEMQKVSGMSFYGLSRLLTRISIQLILAHPGLYIKSLAEGWWYFWRSPVYWSPEYFRLTSVLPILNGVVLIGRLSSFACNMLFLIASLMAVLSKRVRRIWQIPPALWCVIAAIWGSSVLQTIADHGDNPRFLIPLQSLVLLCVLYLAWRTILTRWADQGPQEALRPK